MEEFIPNDVIIKASRAKYKYLAIPSIIIVLNFVLAALCPLLFKQYISIGALAVYFFLLGVFRHKKEFPKHEQDVVIAPMNGKIVQIKTTEQGSIVTIKKPFFDSCEFVTATKQDIPMSLDTESSQVSWTVECSSKKIFINETVDYQAVLIGIVPGNAICHLFVPKRYDLDVSEGGVVEAGHSEIGVLASEI